MVHRLLSAKLLYPMVDNYAQQHGVQNVDWYVAVLQRVIAHVQPAVYLTNASVMNAMVRKMPVLCGRAVKHQMFSPLLMCSSSSPTTKMNAQYCSAYCMGRRF